MVALSTATTTQKVFPSRRRRERYFIANLMTSFYGKE
jgi:hypothetical protein